MRRLGLGSALGLLLLGFVLMHASALVFVAITIVARGVDYPSAVRAVTTDPLATGAAQLAALGAIIALGAWLGAPGQTPQIALGVTPARTRVLIAAALSGLALQLPLVELTTLLTRLVPAMASTPEQDAAVDALTRISSPIRAFSVPFTFVVIAPVTEELLFRGLILRALRERYGSRSAIVLSALMFGAFHGYWQALFFATLMGLLLGVVADRAKSTMPAMALHAGFNALPVLLPEALFEIPGFNTRDGGDVPWDILLGTSVLSVIALGALAWTLRQQEAEREKG